HDSLRLPKRRLLAVFLLSSTHWLLRFSVLDLTLRGLGVDIQWAWTFLIQMVSLSAGQLSLIPGGAAVDLPIMGASRAAEVSSVPPAPPGISESCPALSETIGIRKVQAHWISTPRPRRV
ncbi:lysylphosphatidylglycerol synthase domain-containing protein, partial [Pseudomonas aeruginosa]